MALVTANTSNELVIIGSGVTEFPPLPRPAPPARRPPPPKPAATQPAAIEPPATPKLAQIFSPDQRREYNKILDASLERVQTELEALAKRNLSKEQKDQVERIREFQTQAKQAREDDLVTAVSLAKRADQLAQDLLDRLH